MTIIYGSKGGSSQPSGSEDPNTLKSNSVFKVIDVLGEGPIGGLRNGLQSVFLNDTPVQNKDGSMNFKGVTIEERRGLPDQPHVAGFSELESDYSVNVDVLHSNPVVRTVNNLEADAARVTLTFKQMTSVDGNSVHGAKVEYAIDVQPADGVWHEVKRDTVEGKTSSAYPRQQYIRLDGRGPWNIRVRRLTEDSQTTSRQDSFQWTSYTEIIEGKFTWPGIAYVAMTIDAALFGSSLPKRSYDVIPQLINVPSNYDPEARTYSSKFWDGSFKLAATDNPAWHAYHIATEKMGATTTDKYDVYDIAKFCDELVPDGRGGKMNRCSIDTVFTSARPVQEALADVCSTFRGSFYWSGSSVKFVYDAPAPVSRLFGLSNVLDGGFVVQSSADTTRYNVVNVTFNDPDNGYALTVETVVDEEARKKAGEWIQKDVTMFGQVNRARAHMHGRSILYSDRRETHRITFRPSIADMDLRPGDIVGTSDPKRAGESLSGRIKGYDASARKVTLDFVPSETVKAASDWNIAVRMPSGAWDRTACVIGSDGVVTLDREFVSVPVGYAPWVLIGKKVAPEQWRVISIAETTSEDGGPCFQVDAVEHHPGKYAEIEEGIYLSEDPVSMLPDGPISAPTDLRATAYTRLVGGSEAQYITFSWTPSADPRADSYVVGVRAPGETAYRQVAETQANSIDIEDGSAGEWSFRVCARGSLGTASPWAYRQATVGSLLLPQAPEAVNITVGNRSISMYAVLSSAVAQEFEFWVSDQEVQDVEHNARLIGIGRSASLDGLKPDTVYYLHVRGVNVYGKSGWHPAQAKTSFDFSEEMTLINKEVFRDGGPIDQAVKNSSDKIVQEVDKRIGDFGKSIPDTVNATLKPLEEKVRGMDTDFASYRESVKNENEARTAQIELLKAQDAANISAIQDARIATAAGDTANAASITKLETKTDRATANILQTMLTNVEKGNKALAKLGNDLGAKVDGVSTTARNSIEVESEERKRGEANVRNELTTSIDDFKAESKQREYVQATKDQATRVIAMLAWVHSETGAAGTAYESISNVTAHTASSVQALTVSARLGDLSAEVNQRMTTEIDSLKRTQDAMYTLSVTTSGGRPAVFGMHSNGSVSEVNFLAGKFSISDGETHKTPFAIRDGVAYLEDVKIGSGNVDGFLRSNNWSRWSVNGFNGFELNFRDGELCAQNARIRGEIEATKLKVSSSTGGGRLEITENSIRIWDSNGRLRSEQGIEL